MLLQPAELIAHLAIFEAFFLFRLVFARLGLDVERPSSAASRDAR